MLANRGLCHIFRARLTAGECLSHPWLRRKIPPPPPPLECSKENLKNYLDKSLSIINNSIIIENELNSNNGVIEKDIENEQKVICPHIISSSLTSPKVQDHFESKKNSSQFVKSIQKQSFKENDNATNNLEDGGISKCQNPSEVKTKNKFLSPPMVKNPIIPNQVANNNILAKNEIVVSAKDIKKSQGETNQMSNHFGAMKCPILENPQLKNNLNNNIEMLEKNDSKSSSLNIDFSSTENKLFEPKVLKTEIIKEKIDSKKSATNSVALTCTEATQSTSTLMINKQKEANLIKKIKYQNEEPKIEPFWKRPGDNTISKNVCNFSAISSNSSATQHKNDDIRILLNNYPEGESINMFDFNEVSENIHRSTIRFMENENIASLNQLESHKEEMKIKGEHLPFKQHLRSTPPWFSELNNTNLNSPFTDRNERRSSDFSCFLHSKDDSASLNLADEIRKLSARLLQMSNSQNQNIGSYTTSSPNPRTRNDPITCFLENHGISHPRPKYKFSNLNRDVPIGSPPPPSNIAYYLNMASSIDRNDSHSAPGSPRLSPDRRNIKTDADISSHCVKTDNIRQMSEGSTSSITDKQNEQLNKTKNKSNFPI